MNYRHAYHSGNFADVVKHIVLARVIDYLKRKEKAFRIVDTHAGAGLYAISGPQAQKTGEWRDGIGRLLAKPPGGEAGALLRPYLEAIGAKDGETLANYPGSPLIERRLLRRQDRLSAVELQPDEAASLKALFAGDHQVRVIELDGWLVPGAHLPPKEGRGAVLIDPPFEQEGEFDRLLAALVAGWKRWPAGIYMLWYPVKNLGHVRAFRKNVKASGVRDVIDIEFLIRAPAPDGPPRLDGSGMIVVNAPYTLEKELKIVLATLLPLLAPGGGGRFGVERLVPE